VANCPDGSAPQPTQCCKTSAWPCYAALYTSTASHLLSELVCLTHFLSGVAIRLHTHATGATAAPDLQALCSAPPSPANEAAILQYLRTAKGLAFEDIGYAVVAALAHCVTASFGSLPAWYSQPDFLMYVGPSLAGAVLWLMPTQPVHTTNALCVCTCCRRLLCWRLRSSPAFFRSVTSELRARHMWPWRVWWVAWAM
jgi:hypothetical protein